MRWPLSVALKGLMLVVGEARHHSLAFDDAVEAFGKPIFHGRVQATGHGSGKVRLLRHCATRNRSQPCRARL